jgi:hypothetical protein
MITAHVMSLMRHLHTIVLDMYFELFAAGQQYLEMLSGVTIYLLTLLPEALSLCERWLRDASGTNLALRLSSGLY